MLLRSALVAFATLPAVLGVDALSAKTTQVKAIDKLQLDAAAPMVRWHGDSQAQATKTAPPWVVKQCQVNGCVGDCPTSQNCRAAAAGTEAELSFNFTGTAVTVYGNIWADESMGGLVNLDNLGDVTISIGGQEQAPEKLANSGGKLATINLQGNPNQTDITMRFRPQGYLTVNTIEVTVATAELEGKQVEQNDLSPEYPDLYNTFKISKLADMGYQKKTLAAAGVTIPETRGGLNTGGLSDAVYGNHMVVYQHEPIQREIPAGSYFAILKGPRTSQQSDCWVVWDPKPPSAEAVQLASGYSPENFTQPHEMSAIALDPKQKYTMHVFSQGNAPWGCIFQQLLTYHTADESPLAVATEAAQPSAGAGGNSTASDAKPAGGKSNMGAIIGGVVGGVLGGLLLAGLIVGLCWWRSRKDKKRTRGHAQQISSGSDMTHRSGAPVLRHWRSHSTVESLATSIDSQSNYGDDARQSYPDMALDDAVLPSASSHGTPSINSPSPSFAPSTFGGLGADGRSPTSTTRPTSSRPTTGSYNTGNTHYSTAQQSHSSFGTTHPNQSYEHQQTSYNSVRPSSEYENQQAMLTPGRRLI